MTRNDFSTSIVQPVLAAVLVVALGSLFATSSSGAQKGDKEKSPLAGKTDEIKKMLNAQKLEQEQLFEEYFQKYFFPQFLSKSSGTHDNLPLLRKNLTSFLRYGKSGPPHDRLNDLAFDFMGKIIKGKYDLAVKYNAALVIGDLNEVDGPSKPKPYAKAYKEMVRWLKSPGSEDYLKIGAMIGLARHASLGGVSKETAPTVIDALLKIVNQQEPPGGRDPAAHQFMRRKAAEVLAAIGNVGPSNSVVKAFEAIAADPNARPALRCDVIQYLGQLKYPAGAKADLQRLANSMAHDAVAICKQELEAAKAANRPPSRQLVVYALYSAKDALGGADGKSSALSAAVSGTPAQKFVSTLHSKLKTCQADFDNPDGDEELAEGDLTAKLTELEGILQPIETKKPEVTPAAAKKEVAVGGTEKK